MSSNLSIFSKILYFFKSNKAINNSLNNKVPKINHSMIVNQDNKIKF